MWLRLALLVLSGCVFVGNDCDRPALDCVDAALITSSGQPDGCDLAACVTCVATCGGDCAVQETYPPRYACDDGTFDVYDFCPSWEPPVPGPYVTDVQDLGCGAGDGETLIAEGTAAGHLDVTHFDFADGCCPDAILPDVVASGSTLTVTYTVADDFCDCICGLDVSYAIVDVPAGTWTLAAGTNGKTASVTVP